MNHRRFEKALPYLLVLPAVIGIAIFSLYPFIYNIVSSFTAGTRMAGNFRFVGFENYKYVLGNRTLKNALWNTLVWTFTVTLGQFALGFAMALLCNTRLTAARKLKPIYVFPWAIPGIVATLSWRWMLNGDFGVLNSLLFKLGVIKTYIPFLSSPNTAMASVVLVAIWKSYGYYLLMMYAGLQSIPAELYESAKIDGANSWQSLLHVTLPQMRTLISMALTLGVIWTSNYYDGIYALTGGGPARMTETLAIHIYTTAFVYYRMNDAVIPSILLFLIALVFGSAYFTIKSKSEGGLMQ